MPAKECVKKLIWPTATPLCWSEKNPGQPETTAKLRWRPAFTTEKNRIFGPIFRVPILSQARKRASRATHADIRHATPGSPLSRRVVRRMIHCVASARQALQPFWGYFLVVETQKGELVVRYQNTGLGEILKAVPRRVFGSIVSQHQGDRYGKDFHSWDHLVTLLYGQLGGVSSLRELVELWNVQAPHHYHLGSGPVCRSTVSDANQRRPSAIFAELFAHLTDLASRSLRHDGKQVLRLIDATPIPLTSLHEWASWNGRTRGLKAHVVYDPNVDRPVHLEITSSTVNDVMIARDLSIERGAI